MGSMLEAEERNGKKEPQGPSLWWRGNLKGIVALKQRKRGMRSIRGKIVG